VTMTVGWFLLSITILLVIVGCALWASGSVGLGQFFLVMASGTAGGTVALFVESRLPPQHDTEYYKKQPP